MLWPHPPLPMIFSHNLLHHDMRPIIYVPIAHLDSILLVLSVFQAQVQLNPEFQGTNIFLCNLFERICFGRNSVTAGSFTAGLNCSVKFCCINNDVLVRPKVKISKNFQVRQSTSLTGCVHRLVGWLVSWSDYAFVRRSERRTFLALFFSHLPIPFPSKPSSPVRQRRRRQRGQACDDKLVIVYITSPQLSPHCSSVVARVSSQLRTRNYKRLCPSIHLPVGK